MGLTAALLSGCDDKGESTQASLPSTLPPEISQISPTPHQIGSAVKPKPFDFITMSPTATSNAALVGKPPAGFIIVCDHEGHYSVAKDGFVFTGSDEFVRTNEYEAIVAAWIIKEVQDEKSKTLKPTKGQLIHWEACDK
jgi:hypothetical protein